MRGSVLIFGGTKEQREDKVLDTINSILGKNTSNEALTYRQLRNKADVKFIDLAEDKKSIGIAEAKEGVKFLSEKPFEEKVKVLVILQAEKLTRDAQNALLKVLEEPPSFAVTILCAKTVDDLLETVISRCRKVQIIRESHKETENQLKTSLKSLLKMDIGKRLDWATEFSKEEKEEVIETLEGFIKEGREELLKTGSKNAAENISTLLETKTDLETTNVNLRLRLEVLALLLS